MEISLRYPPVTGRLHTRYAPVRRSPAVYCYTPLPLDLHVLSLPLAFILSQDQTLHCKNCLSLPFWLVFVSHTYPHMYDDTRYLYSLIRFKQLSLFRRKRVQRYNHFPNRQNIFSSFFEKISLQSVKQHITKRKIFPYKREISVQNAPKRGRKGKNRGTETDGNNEVCVFVCKTIR